MPVLPPPRLSAIPCCPKCGVDLSLSFDPTPGATTADRDAAAALKAAQRQIDDLQAQIRLLNNKATAAVDRWADYEDELTDLRRDLQKSRQGSLAAPQTPVAVVNKNASNGLMSPTKLNPGHGSPSAASVSSFATAATNRISALLSRKSTPNLKSPSPSPGHQPSYSTSNLLPTPPPSGGAIPGHTKGYSTSSLHTPKSPLSLSLSSGQILSYTPGSSPAPSTDDLLDALTREQSLRLAAEGKLNETSREVEELSVTLFEQANEMVASERRARAQLEERVGELEKRDKDKAKRLLRLESAMGRIERARNLLKEEIAVQAAGK